MKVSLSSWAPLVAIISKIYCVSWIFPCDADGVQTNFPELGSIVAPVELFCKLNTTSSIELSVILAVNVTVFSTSTDLFEIVFSCNTASTTSKTLSPSNSSCIVKPSSSFSSPVNPVAL